jgi:MraZ protein
VDKQGRILIPSNLREYAGIEKEVVSVGVNTKVEIWSKERYATMETGFEEMDDIMEQLSEMGIQL